MTIYIMKQNSFLGYGSRYLLSAKQQTLTGNRLLTTFEFGIRTELKARPQMTVSYRKVRRQCYLSKSYCVLPLDRSFTYKREGSQIRSKQNIYVIHTNPQPAISPSKESLQDVHSTDLVFPYISITTAFKLHYGCAQHQDSQDSDSLKTAVTSLNS